MKVYALKLEEDGFPGSIPIDHDLGIKIVHNDKKYSLGADTNGKLVLRSLDQTQLVILPRASNSVEIE